MAVAASTLASPLIDDLVSARIRLKPSVAPESPFEPSAIALESAELPALIVTSLAESSTALPDTLANESVKMVVLAAAKSVLASPPGLLASTLCARIASSPRA